MATPAAELYKYETVGRRYCTGCDMYLQEADKSGVILKDIEKADAKRIKFNLEKNWKKDCKYMYNKNLKKNVLLMKVGKYYDNFFFSLYKL